MRKLLTLVSLYIRSKNMQIPYEEELCALADAVWETPEPGFREYKSSAAHVEFLKNTCKLKEYYDMSLIPLTLRQRTIRTLISCCGMRILTYIKS